MRYLGRILISHWLLCPLLTLLLLAGSLVDAPLLRLPELPLYDWLLTLRDSRPVSRVVLLSVDQQSRAELGESISSRTGLTRILDKLQSLGVEQLAILDPLSFTADPRGDRDLAGQLARFRTVLVLEPRHSQILATDLPTGTLLSLPKPLPAPRQLLLELRNPLAGFRLNQPGETAFLPPAEVFRTPQLHLGQFQKRTDLDGRIRGVPLLVPSGGGLLPSLPLQLLLLQTGTKAAELGLPPRELPGILQVGSRQIPLDHDYQLQLELAGSSPPYRSYSIAQLLSGELDEQKLTKSLVLLGPTGIAGDPWLVANRGPTSNSELAALATATLLTDNPPRRLEWGWQVEALALAFFLVLLLLLAPRLSGLAGLLTMTLFYLVWLFITAVSMVNYGYWLHPTPAFLLCLGGFSLVRWNIDSRQRRRGRQETERQLAVSLLEQGRLDQALDKFLQFSPRDQVSKEMLYNLGLDFERKRMPHKAQTAYRHLLKSGRFRDARERLELLQPQESPGARPVRNEGTLVLDRPGEKPTLGRYRIERELGQGAMGTVYLGVDPKINRQVAIKTLDYQQIDTDQLPEVKERFFREAEAAGRLNHPGIVTIYDVGEESDLAYLAMELLDGKDLSHACHSDKLLPLPRVIEILHQVALALDYAHRQGVVHRDIKPANILLPENGQVKVVDFGVARVIASSKTETGLILGTPSYMSPEQVAGKKVDGRSDLFSLGVVMYELLSGEKPFQGESLAALMYNIANCKYRPLADLQPKLPKACREILAKLLQKTLSRRFKSAALLAGELATLQRRLGRG